MRSVAVLASGTFASQVILLATAPLLTRLYNPDQFGLLAAYMAIVTILGAIATLRYELVIPLPRHDGMAVNALALTMACVIATALLCGLALLAAGDWLANVLNMPDLPAVSWLVPFGVLSMGTYTAFNNWAVRRRSFGTIARTKLTQSVSQTAIQIGSAFTPFATLGLLFGNLLGQSAGISSFLREFRRDDRSTLRLLSWRRAWFLARHYWHFPVFSLPASVAFSASQQAPALVMFALFGPSTAGFYLLAQRVGMMPATLLGTAMSQSIYRNLADQKKQPDAIGRAVAVPVRVMSNLIIGPAIGAAAIAPPLIGLVFGHDWVEAGQYLRWMTPWVAVTITFGAMTPVVSILGLQKMGLVFQLGSLLLGLAAMYLAGPLWGPVAAIAGFSLVKALCIILYRLHMFHLVGVSPRPIALSMLWQSAFFIATFGLAAALLETSIIEGALRWVMVSLLCLSAAGVYVAINLRSIAQLSPAPSQRISASRNIVEPERID